MCAWRAGLTVASLMILVIFLSCTVFSLMGNARKRELKDKIQRQIAVSYGHTVSDLPFSTSRLA